MQLRDKESWEKSLKNNDDGVITEYGGSVMFFSELWALLMEAEMADGAELKGIADGCSHAACKIMKRYGVTGFQYGVAVSLLSLVWVHGEELRKWHNLVTQIQDEGEKANESGGVLNPALLNIAGEEE